MFRKLISVLGILGVLATGAVGQTFLQNNAEFTQVPDTAVTFIAGCTGAITRTVAAKLGEVPGVSVVDCGADPTGVADSTTAFQNAFNSVPTTGGLVLCPAGTYKISSTLTIGNGTSASMSTSSGLFFTGVPGTNQSPFGAYAVSPGCKINWSGAASTPILDIRGPYMGGGVQNVQFLCNSVTGAIGLRVTSVQYADNRNIYFNNCFKSIISRTVDSFSGNETDSLHDIYETVSLNVPDVAGAIGITLTNSGNATVSSDTDFADFKNVSVQLGSPVNAIVGVLLQVTDGNLFTDMHFASGAGASQAIKFDYSVNANFPNGNRFYGVDPGPTGNGGTRVAWAETGSPVLNGPNYVYGIAEGNGGIQPQVPSVNYAPQVVTPGVDVSRTIALSATNLLPYNTIINGMYQICYYVEITTGDLGGAQLTVNIGYTDDAGAKTYVDGTSIPVTAGSARAYCVPARLANNTMATISTTLSAGTTTLVYQLHARVMKLD